MDWFNCYENFYMYSLQQYKQDTKKIMLIVIILQKLEIF